MIEGMTYEQYLEKNEKMIYSNVGVSMLPLLRQGKDLFIVKKKSSKRCLRGDVVLYRRPPNHYVLHRIIEVNKNSYTILGDNCIKKEYNIKDKDIIGVMTGFVRNGKEYTTSNRLYKLYTRFWLFFNPLRVFLLKCIFKSKRIVGSIIKKAA